MTSTLDNEATRASFLAENRLGILITNRADGSPVGVPVWFEWTGDTLRMFADKSSHKVTRLKTNPIASLLVTNHVGEAEAWIAFDGEIDIKDAGAFELAERLAHRYWDMNNPARIEELAGWRQYAEGFCLLTMTPNKIRTGS